MTNPKKAAHKRAQTHTCPYIHVYKHYKYTRKQLREKVLKGQFAEKADPSYDDFFYKKYIDGLVQDCSISIADALEILQPCPKPSIYVYRRQAHDFPCALFVVVWSWSVLTHWGRATHICVGKLTTIDSDNGLLLGRRQAIIWTNAGILLIGPWRTNFSEILIGIQTFLFKKMHLKMSSAKWRPFVSASMC